MCALSVETMISINLFSRNHIINVTKYTSACVVYSRNKYIVHKHYSVCKIYFNEGMYQYNYFD